MTPEFPGDLAAENQRLREQVSTLQRQLDWFQRQLFGAKSEKRLGVGNPQQLCLRRLSGEAKRAWRQDHTKPITELFFALVQEQLEHGGLLPKSPLTTALAYARQRRGGLELLLSDPEVAIDTNHRERALRVVPVGRKNWLFCWTELGAQQLGILQSLLVSCRLQQIDAFDYLVDVLQRIDRHPN